MQHLIPFAFRIDGAQFFHTDDRPSPPERDTKTMSDEKGTPPETHEYASPPCFMHELEPGFRAETGRLDAWADVARWRKAERARLIDERLLADPDTRKARSERIAAELDLAIGKVSGRSVSVYWPFRGEPDLRNWAPV